MADKTNIEWTDATWNPVTGCSKVSQGCKHCYAEREWPRMTKLVPAYAGRDFTDVRTHGSRLDQPARWAKRRMIFVNSMSDLFHEAVPDEFIDSVFGVMWACLWGRKGKPGHVFQVLTKRADRMRDYLTQDRREKWATAAVHHGGANDPDGMYDQVAYAEGPHPRIWLGVSVEDQAAADERIPLLLETPAAVRWISAEPLLGRVDLRHNTGTLPWIGGKYGDGRSFSGGIDWVVAGGESGPKARPMHPAWARDLRDQCAAAGVPFLFKQWGEFAPYDDLRNAQKLPIGVALSCWPTHGPDAGKMVRVGKKIAGRLLDGGLHDGYPMSGEIVHG